MSREQVSAVTEYGPYSVVNATAGLETKKGLFAGQQTNISFVFESDQLRKIQIWAYQGDELGKAFSAIRQVYEYFDKEFGGVDAKALGLEPGAKVEQVMNALTARLLLVPKSEVVKAQLAPIQQAQGKQVFASFFRHPQHGYYVFVYHQLP